MLVEVCVVLKGADASELSETRLRARKEDGIKRSVWRFERRGEERRGENVIGRYDNSGTLSRTVRQGAGGNYSREDTIMFVRLVRFLLPCASA